MVVYQKLGISLRNGGSYFLKDDKGWTNPRQTSLLSIEDIMDDSNDISKSSFAFFGVKQSFYHSFISLTSTMNAHKMNGTQPRSLLGCIVGVSADARLWREKNSFLVDQKKHVDSSESDFLCSDTVSNDSAQVQFIENESSDDEFYFE